MGRRADTLVDPVDEHPLVLALAPLTSPEGLALPADDRFSSEFDQGPQSHVLAFVLGTVIGALAGTLVATLISPHTRAYLVGLYQLASRRLSSAERDKLRFELLLQ